MDIEEIKRRAIQRIKQEADLDLTPQETALTKVHQVQKDLDLPHITDEEFFNVGFVPRALSVELINSFLLAYARTGNYSASCRAVGTHVNTMKNAEKKNPQLKILINEVQEALKDAAEQELYERAVNGTKKPVVFKGEIVDFVREHDSKYLIKLLEAINPDKWTPAKKLLNSGDGGLTINLVKISTGETEEIYNSKENPAGEVIDVESQSQEFQDGDNSTISVETQRLSDSSVEVHGDEQETEGGDGLAPEGRKGSGSG